MPKRFGAVLEERGIYVIEYASAGDGIHVLAHSSVAGDFGDIGAAANALGDVIASMNGRGGAAVVAVRGFGVYYRLLTLPPADREVLEPVVEREMKRLYPEVTSPVVDFAVLGRVERRAAADDDAEGVVHERRAAEPVPPAEVLAGTAPTEVVDAITRGLARHGVTLEHLTIAAQAMARVYAETDGAPGPSAVAMMLPGGPLFGVFHNGGLRFVTEPPATSEDASREIQTVIDQLSRGRMYLRQRFRGADISRIYAAVDAADEDHFRAVLSTSLDVDVFPLASGVGPPGAVAALGAVLDAKRDEGLTLYPSRDVRRKEAERRRARLSTTGAWAIGALVLAWALWSAVTARVAVGELRDARAATATAIGGIEPVRAVAAERRANVERRTAINSMTAARQRLSARLSAIGASAPPEVELRQVTVDTDPRGAFHGEISGIARGSSGAFALRALHRYVENLPQALGSADVQLADFTQTEEDDTVVSFRVSFAVPPLEAAP